MKYEPLIPERVTFAEMTGGRRCELWRTPQRGTGWTLYFYEGEAEISATPMESELRGRIEFEKKVEEMTV
jgi:hypothetical protein